MTGFIDFLLVFFFIIVPIAGVSTQLIPIRLQDVTFRETTPTIAWKITGQYALGTFEQRFGYPTGYFYPDEKLSDEGVRLRMKEAQPSGAITDGCSVQIGSLGAAGMDAGCGAGCLWAMAVGFIGAPFFAVSFLDRFARLLLRSRVDVRFAKSGADTTASFAFYGLGGYVLRNQYAKAFAKPELPVSLTEPAQTGLGQQPAGSAA